MLANHQEYKIAGHSVLFPCKPYPSQFSMMDKIIKGIERNQNCLLESPTGSGKSLALLCSALAWQTEEKRKQFEEKQTVCEGKSEACTCSCHSQKSDGPPRHPAASAACTVTTTAATTTSASSPAPVSSCAAAPSECGEGTPRSAAASADGASCIVIDDDSDEDFRPLKKFREPGQSHVTTRKKKKGRLSIEYEDSPPPSPGPSTAASSPAPGVQQSEPLQAPSVSKKVPATPSVSPCSQCACEKGTQKGTHRKVPKIYYGTRTHKQVAQIVRELGKTAYHEVAMTILASREHTCIHPQVSNSGNKNEGCENLLKDAGCRFKDRVMKFQSQSAIKSMGLHSAWDLEDLVELMKKKKACPYFLSRGIKDQSDLIICPYNYLVDPLIRDSMEINLKGQIVILDEAHNIEDCVREAASQSITQEQIQRALHDMDVLMEKGVKVADISKLRQMCHKLDMFIEEQSSQLTQHDFEQSYRMWSGFEIVAQLQRLDLRPQDCHRLTAKVASIKAAEAEERLHSTGQEQQSLSTATWTLLDQIFLVLKYMYKDNMKYAEDYRASIVKSIQYVSASLNGSWLNSRRKFGGRKTPVEVFTLNFWCMNPAVGFADFECCRSVILTSGTLSPMDSFQSELGMPFPIVLEANHIIKDSQVWVGAVGQGPNGKSLQAVYRNMESYEFQDSLGELVLGVCKRVPKGVLCFLPSYKTLEKLANRWKMTGLWSRMEEHKHVLCEPRGSDKMDFEQIIQGFYSIIHGSEEHEGGAGGVDGALFFAVCRGKVSEGMDFADNFARAVITVGIPYPNFKDIQVELKRKYNDRYQSSRGLLSGHLWYEIQAFRALNQALGRCIRHRKDWGALIIVDDRFIKNTNKYANGLSKWVRQKLRVYRDCPSMMESLSTFTKARLEADQQDSSSQLPSTPLTPASQTTASVHLNTGALLPVRHVSVSSPEGTENKQRIAEPLQSGQGHPILLPVQVPLQVLPPGNHLLQGQSPTASPLSQISVLMAPPGGGAVGVSAVRSNGVITVVSTPTHTAGGTRLTSLLPRQPLHITASGQSCPTTVRTLAVPAGCTAQSPRSAAPDSRGRSSACVSVANAGGHPLTQTLVANTRVHHSPHTSAATVRGILTSQAATGSVTSATSPGSSDILSVPTNTPMMYLPVSDPSLKPTMLLLPTAMPSQTVMKLPPHLQAALGMEMLAVPAGIRHVVVAGTLEQASALFQGHKLQPEPGVAPPQHTVQKSLLVGQAAPGTQSGGRAQSVTGGSDGAAAAEGPSSMGGSSVKSENAVVVAVPVPAVAGVSGLQLKTAAPGSTTQTSNQKPGKCVPASTSLAWPKGGSVGSPPGVLRSCAPTPTSCSSVSEASTSGKNSSQASECITSPSLFGDTQKSQSSSSSEEQVGKTPPPPAKPKPTRRAARIPVPWQMTTRSSAASPQAAPAGNTQSLSVASPSPQAGSKTHDSSKASAGAGPGEQGKENPNEDKENPNEDVAVLLKKLLFRNTPRKGGTSNNSLPASDQPSGAEREKSKMPALIEPDRSTESLGSALVQEAAPAADSDTDTAGSGAEVELKLQRRVRGSKRRSLSLGRGSKKRRQDEDVLGSVGPAATSSVKCTACGYMLLDEVKDSDFERRETMPTCLQGMADPSKPEVLYFKGSAVTERLPASAAGKCRRQQSSGGLEASVQLIHCPGCAGGATSSTLNTLLGAKVTVTDPAAAASAGQMWLFTHMVTMTSTSM